MLISSTLDIEATTHPHTITPSQPTLPVPVKAVIGVIGGLTLLCLLMIIPPLVVYVVQRIKYKLEKRVLEQTSQELESIPETETDSCQPIVEKPDSEIYHVPQKGGRGRFEQSEIFSYIRDL